MTYTIEFTTKASDYVRKLSEQEREQLVQKLYSLRENPFPSLKKLRGSRLWRLRVGKFRAVLDVVIKGKRIVVLRVGHRRNVYD